MFIDFNERGRERERDIDQFFPLHALTRDRTHNLGMCPEWGSNPQLFGVQDNAPTNWATWPGLWQVFFWGGAIMHYMYGSRWK